jgi:Ca2+-binding RTX toxin-like protein
MIGIVSRSHRARKRLIGTGNASDPISTGSDSDLIITGSDSDLIITGSDSDLIITGSDSDLIITGSDSDLIITGSDSDLGRNLSQRQYEQKYGQPKDAAPACAYPELKATASCDPGRYRSRY